MKSLRELYPTWQFNLREAAEVLNTPLFERTDDDIERLNARAQDRIQGKNLLFVLTTIFGIPVAALKLDRNYYAVDGFCFALKAESVPDEDDRQPLYVSTSGGNKSQATVTFTLYIGKVNADPAYPDWPRRRVLVGRNVHLYNTGYSRLRAELAALIDDLEAAYQAEVPRYQAWKAIELLPPPDADALQDYFLQLVRRSLRRMPTAEVLPIPQADAADAATELDGMLPPNFEPFNPNDAPDDSDDEDDDDKTPSPDLGYQDEPTEPDTVVEPALV